MKTKDNAQYKNTDRKLKATFTRLIGEKKRQRITIQDICLECGINRSTFYAHFEDINALLDCLMADFIAAVIKESIRFPNNDLEKLSLDAVFSPDYIEIAIKQIQAHKDLYLYYIEQSTYHNAQKYVEQLLDDIVVSKLKRNHAASASHLRYYYAYVIAGTAAIIDKWLYSGMKEETREIAEIICRSMPMLKATPRNSAD